MYSLLIVDDEPSILAGLKCTLDWQKFNIDSIETATSYDEAVAAAIKSEPDIGIFDVCIGQTRGYEIINKLNELHLQIKCIMISGYDQFEYAQKAIRCGAKDYLLKPIDRKALQDAVRNIVIRDLHGVVREDAKKDDVIDPVLNIRYDTLSKLTRKIILMIKAESSKSLSLKNIADQFKMNSTYLGQIFLKETHMKFSEYTMIYRLMFARSKIENTNEKISYIAYSAGYSNLNYFYAQFKDFFNCSPSELRNQKSNVPAKEREKYAIY